MTAVFESNSNCVPFSSKSGYPQPCVSLKEDLSLSDALSAGSPTSTLIGRAHRALRENERGIRRGRGAE